ncbi:MerR-like DNA binding protein [Aquabacter spiritensis]|uniref:MerR-like DNA binding protein n=1 Tax=Aquabacter spiritensis TaxID=933073 RepID=A0A4R3LMF6_9HYPH|nr:MerR-like DNA binding protein [Aquabacter spiritensis]
MRHVAEARSSDKSPDAFRTISEVAEHLALPQHVLRFWETRFAEIKPVKRAGGRRFYRPDDVDLLRAIRHLLYSEGYTIKGVQRILKDQGARQIQAMGADLLGGTLPPPPPEAPAVRKGAESGPGRGGLLGLLPRRRVAPDAHPSEADARGGTEPRVDQSFERDAYLPGFEAPPAETNRAEPSFLEPETRDSPVRPAAHAAHHPAAPKADPTRTDRKAPRRAAPPPEDSDAGFADDFDDFAAAMEERQQETPALFDAPAPRPLVQAKPPAPPRRPTRGPASRIPDPPPAPELEDPLLPFFDDAVLPLPGDSISEPLDARIRRLKEHAPPDAVAPAGRPVEGEGPRVGPLRAPVDAPEETAGRFADFPPDDEPPPPSRPDGPPEQYLPPHLRSAHYAAAHAPRPVLSRDDVNRLQAALYELGECRRLIVSALAPPQG